MGRRTVGTQENITLRDIYDIVDRLETKMDARLGKLEGRMDSVETWRDRALGTLSVFTAFIGLASSWLWTRIMER